MPAQLAAMLCPLQVGYKSDIRFFLVGVFLLVQGCPCFAWLALANAAAMRGTDCVFVSMW